MHVYVCICMCLRELLLVVAPHLGWFECMYICVCVCLSELLLGVVAPRSGWLSVRIYMYVPE